MYGCNDYVMSASEPTRVSAAAATAEGYQQQTLDGRKTTINPSNMPRKRYQGTYYDGTQNRFFLITFHTFHKHNSNPELRLQTRGMKNW